MDKPPHFQFGLRSAFLSVAALAAVIAFISAEWRNHVLRKATAVQLRLMGIFVAGDLYDVSIEGVQSDEEMAVLFHAINKGGGPERLTLVNSEITDRSCQMIASLPRLKSLTIESEFVTDDGIAYLAGRKWNTLAIWRANITVDGLTTLLEESPIIELSLFETPQTTEQIEMLAKEFPSVRFDYSAKNKSE